MDMSDHAFTQYSHCGRRPGNQRLIDTYLRKEGYRTDRVVDGRGPAPACRPQRHLVILDLMIPEIDGWEVLRRIRNRARAGNHLVGEAEETESVLGLGPGADDYPTKPFSAAELIAR